MESANVELSYRYVELGLGISFATLAGDPSLWRDRNLAFIPLDEYFPPDYLAVVMKPDKTLSSYKSAFLRSLLPHRKIFPLSPCQRLHARFSKVFRFYHPCLPQSSSSLCSINDVSVSSASPCSGQSAAILV